MGPDDDQIDVAIAHTHGLAVLDAHELDERRMA
jgi:hypothetical protein